MIGWPPQVRALLVLLLAVAAAALLTTWSNRLPTAQPANAALTTFSAARATSVIGDVARVPHPTGTPANDRTRAVIVARLRALDLTPRTEAGVGLSPTRAGSAMIAAGTVTNVVATIPGRDRLLPAIVLMAHYDSVPNSPGAADDALGVAVLLETARALRATGAGVRDVTLLFTDGEEPGLLGASLHFADPAAVRRVGAILNFEAMGDGGRALMFETHADAGNFVRLYADAVDVPAADSFSASLYRLLPNGTDLTLPLGKGVPGLNFAITGRRDGYHSMRSTPTHVDPRSVQHMGDIALALTSRLSRTTTLPTGGGDRAYFDVAGHWLVHYPAWAGWLVLAVAACGIAIGVARTRPRLLALVRGAGWMIGVTLAVAVILWAAGVLAGVALGGFGDRTSLLDRVGWVQSGVLAIAAAVLVAVVGPLARRPRTAAIAVAGIGVLLALSGSIVAIVPALIAAALLWLCRLAPDDGAAWPATLIVLLALAIAFQVILPGGAYLVAVPLALSGIAFAVSSRPALRIATVALATLAFAFVMVQIDGTFVDFGAATPQVMAIFVPLVLATMLPWLSRAANGPAASTAAAALLVGGMGAMLVPAVTAGVRNVEVYRFIEAGNGRQYLASGTPALDDRARDVLARDDAQITQRRFGPPLDAPLWVAPTSPVPVAAPRVGFRYDAARRRLTLTIQPAAGTLSFRIALRSSVRSTRVDLQGRATTLNVAPEEWATIRYAAPPSEGIELGFDDIDPGTMELSVVQTAANGVVPALPPGTMPWRNGGATTVHVRERLRWEAPR